MIGNCEACDRQNVPVSNCRSSSGETTQCFICQGEDFPDPYGEMPEMKEGGQCPYCGGPTVNVGFEFITCGAGWNDDCFGHLVRVPVKQWSADEIMASFDAAIRAIKSA